MGMSRVQKLIAYSLKKFYWHALRLVTYLNPDRKHSSCVRIWVSKVKLQKGYFIWQEYDRNLLSAVLVLEVKPGGNIKK